MGDRDSGDNKRRRLEGVIPELIKRAVELGVEKAVEAPDTVKHFMGDLRMPKEIAGYLLSQVDDTKNGMLRVVAKETRDFLEQTNLAGEMKRLLTTLKFEINTTIRFTPNDGPEKDESGEKSAAGGAGKEKLPRPEVKTDMYVKREERARERRRPKE